MIKAVAKFQYHTLIQVYVSPMNFLNDGTAIPCINEVKYSNTVAHAQITDISIAERTLTIVYQPRLVLAHIISQFTCL